ncbi:MAG: transglycosylase domain-containing protein [Firmicutes bacterium]|nr:transglycosylase domain-containing protein [Bacillota bacterium]
MSNYDDYNPRPDSEQEVHRSRRAKKEKEALALAKVQDSAQDKPEKKSNSRKKKSGKKYRLNFWQFFKFMVCICLICALGVVGYVASIIVKAPDIETDNIYSLLSQSSVLYDDEGEIIDNVFAEQNRTLVEISQIPDHVQYAFIALEDKTFETHNGFNIIRIFGAIKDAILHGGGISGTSTITQQLARNLYLEDKMSERSLDRKLTEAYYAIILEKKLNKDQILEAYLNTVNFGSGWGVQTAAQAYFSKDIEDITIAEAAWLAAMPQAPSSYALVYSMNKEELTEDAENVITTNGNTAYVWNDKAKPRMLTCLALMHEQGYISDAEYEEAKATELKDIVNPSLDALNTVSNYFADYVIKTVISDLQEEYGYDYSKAYNLVYNGGLNIYTTMDSQAQAVIEKEFKDDDNFPEPISYKKDKDGNILNEAGNIMLHKYSNYIEEDGAFKLKSSEYEWNEDGSLTIFAGKRLLIYNTTVNGQTDYSVEFKSMYTIENDHFYSIAGGYVNIPQQYKSRDKDNNLVVSAQFFTDYPEFFKEDGKKLSTHNYSLKQKVIQPQAAMTIIDNSTGSVKAMIGGRKTSGRMLFNRATSPRQPGSSIKPLAVYAAALQQSFELQKEGLTSNIHDPEFDQQGAELWGTYLTAGSIIDDEPTKINGKKWPVNSYRSYKGLYTFRTALQQSVNVCAVKLLTQVGVDYAFDIAERFGLTTLVKEGNINDLNLAALGMGGMTNGATTLEMASAYSTFVNEGIHKSHTCYTKVTTRNGDILLEPIVEETEVLDPGVAWIMRDVLQTVVSEGIAGNARVKGEKVGGKTGTTSDSYDIWFDGFTANYSAAVWIGNDVNIKLSSMSGKAASLWGNIMGQIDDAKGGKYSKRPENVIQVEIDTKSGMLATEDSSSTRSEYFTTGTQPTEAGSLSVTVEICEDSGYLATPGCPYVETDTGIMRPYVPNEKVKDIKNEVPHYYCNEHNVNPEVYPVDPEVEDDITIVDPIPEITDPVIDPTNPDNPYDPFNPTDPTDPVIPPDPVDPVTPVDPVIPPVDPDIPADGELQADEAA